MINTLDSLQSFMTDQDQSGRLYWVILHNLLPLVQHTRQFTYQKSIAPYLAIHPAKLSSFITMTNGLTTTEGYTKDIDLDSIKREIEAKWGTS